MIFCPQDLGSNIMSTYLSSHSYPFSGVLLASITGNDSLLTFEIPPGTHSLIIEGTVNDVTKVIGITNVELTPCNSTNHEG